MFTLSDVLAACVAGPAFAAAWWASWWMLPLTATLPPADR